MAGNKKLTLKKIGMGALTALGGAYLARMAFGYLAKGITYPLITDKFEENLWELATSVQRININKLIETELRAETKSFIERPIGGPKKFKYLDKIMFNIAQLETLPAPRETNIDTGVVIGPLARKPLKLKIPILVAGMSYGLALTEAYKIAFARGASAAGTATNTGLGPWLESERKAARHLILQYSRIDWNKDERIIKQSDAMEIQFGQGANAGAGKTLKAEQINGTLRKRMGLQKGQDAVIHNRIEGIGSGKDLASLINYLKEITGGVPVGVKMGAGKYLEEDLKIAVEAGADFVSVDGAEGGTHGSLPILEDDFGVPAMIAASRAAKFWEDNGLKGKVSLLVGGQLVTPGDCLKMIALGADAVYMGTAILIAATHNQVLKTIPFEPPTQIAYEHGKYSGKFDIAKGADSLYNFLHSTVYEMEEAVKSLGKTAIRDVSKEDIFAIDRDVAEIAGIELGFHAPANKHQKRNAFIIATPSRTREM
ncbi:ferredoxin-dependent glutamate synthase [Desulfocucumis palustris]|uniref:Ferredoxin-dependent glutamate synthase n=1 Tax=Desulfocucumis palustris TaxID=1898651 RepID=A0A2L2XFF6_9FIRM|nr:FMN-binding glutamate synthase family protein [Desulfocucumis palustris]GBF35077.1 ferredoxin-dependent glutamate synthase [Desulfocucumis palustris]